MVLGDGVAYPQGSFGYDRFGSQSSAGLALLTIMVKFTIIQVKYFSVMCINSRLLNEPVSSSPL